MVLATAHGDALDDVELGVLTDPLAVRNQMMDREKATSAKKNLEGRNRDRESMFGHSTMASQMLMRDLAARCAFLFECL